MHAFLDRYSVSVTMLLMKNHKWFNQSLESPTFKEHFEALQIPVLEIQKEGVYEVSAITGTGLIDPAFDVVQWIGYDVPTLIYHHGNNEQPFSYTPWSKNTFRSVILKKKHLFKANIINIRAPFHNNGMNFYLEKIGVLGNFTAMLAGSVALIESLIESLHQKGNKQIIISGLSLGGWVTNLHRSFFNTADTYIPMLAAAGLDALFLTSYYRNLCSMKAREHSEILTKVLNFEEEFSSCKTNNVFPLLAKYDQFIEYERQKQSYKDIPIQVLEKGHITAALASNMLTEHLLKHLYQPTL